MKIKIDSKAKGGAIWVNGELAGRLESFSSEGGVTYIYAFKPGGEPMAYYRDYEVVGRVKWRSHITRAKAFAKELFQAAGSIERVIETKRETGETGDRLIESARRS